MVYQNKFVACIKANGKVLREVGQSVVIPFGSEYSVLVKNLNSVRVKIKVSVDGIDATSGTWLVVAPNSSLELERFITNGNWSSGNRFKFIERSGDIEAHRGVKMDDGLVRVEWKTEVVRPIIPVPHYEPYDVPYPVPTPYPDPWYPRPRRPRGPFLGNATRSLNRVGASSGTKMRAEFSNAVNFDTGVVATSFTSDDAGAVVMNSAESMTDIGITVPGSVSHQNFVPVADFETTGTSEVVVIQLRGSLAGKPVARAVTVDAKLTCQSCGKVSKSDVAYCPNCGTALAPI